MKSLCALQQEVHCVICQAWAVSKSRGEGRRKEGGGKEGGGRREGGRREGGRREEGGGKGERTEGEREGGKKGRGNRGKERSGGREEEGEGERNSKWTPWKMVISVPHSLAELDRQYLAKEHVDWSFTVIHFRFTYCEHNGRNTKC